VETKWEEKGAEEDCKSAPAAQKIQGRLIHPTLSRAGAIARYVQICTLLCIKYAQHFK